MELLATAPEGLTISEIAARLGRSISEIFRMIVVMERRYWLQKDADTDRYRVTYKVLDVAYRATPAQELAHVAAPVLYELAHQIQQSCHLVVQYGNRALVVLRQESPGEVSFAVRLGTAVDLVASCSGHVLLSFMEPDQREQTLREVSYPVGLDEEDLRSIIERVRKRGYETMASARTTGVRDLSYPVFRFDGKVAAALTIPFVTFIDGSQSVDFESARARLADAAMRISRGLGWAAPKAIAAEG
jgi:DNA-binding IclR family transcriptional regulator